MLHCVLILTITVLKHREMLKAAVEIWQQSLEFHFFSSCLLELPKNSTKNWIDTKNRTDEKTVGSFGKKEKGKNVICRLFESVHAFQHYLKL